MSASSDRLIRFGRPPAPIIRREGAHLPHWTREGAEYAVNFRLDDSIPRDVLKKWIAERDGRLRNAGQRISDAQRQAIEAAYNERIERYLDAGYGA